MGRIAYHSYFIGRLRVCLDVEVESGNHASANYGHAGLWRILDAFPPAQRPLFVRGIVTVESTPTHEFMVLVTDFDAPILSIAQLYRDRADVEPERSGDSQPKADRRASAARQNCFDELKNQWGWGGFTTKDMARSQTMARLVALVYNCWNMFVGLVEPDKHAEAITSRPQLLHGVGRVTQIGRQTTLTVTSTHDKAAQTQERQSWAGRFFGKLREIAEQLTQLDTWRIILSRVYFRFLKGHIIGTPHHPNLPSLESVNCGS